jgi:hypothetical protein
LRIVGQAQVDLGAWAGARETFEFLLTRIHGDIETNRQLGRIYRNLGDLPRSSQAIQRIIDSKDATSADFAEAFALQGRNAEERWVARLKDLSGEQVRTTALGSLELKQSIDMN